MGCSPSFSKERRVSIIEIQNNNPIYSIKTAEKDILILQEKQDPFMFYSILEFIKQSKYNLVYKVKLKKSNEIRMMKIFNLQNKSNVTEKDIMNQIDILKTLSHPNIIKLYRVFYYANKIYLIYEYCPEGNLFEYITSSDSLNENKSRQIMYQIISALNYLHHHKIILCNLSPEHIVIQNKNKDNNSIWVKIIDFGAFNLLSFNNNNIVISSGYKTVSNLNVVPPEMNLSFKTDIWSCGVIMYFLLSGDYPFKGHNIKEIRTQISIFNNKTIKFEGEIWDDISTEGKNFLGKLLEFNQYLRPNSQNLLEEPWLKYDNEKGEKIFSSNAFKNAIKNAKNFHNKNQIKEWLISFIIRHLAKSEDLDSLRNCFVSLDKDSDGIISKEDLLIGLNKIMTPKEAEDEANIILNNIHCKNGEINYDDFIKASVNKEDLINDKNLTFIFKLIDKDHSGRVSKEELKQFFLANKEDEELKKFLELKKKNKNDIFTQFIDELDISGDGMLNLKEFKQLMVKC